ncbi:GGDEF domain-containing protein [Vibrio clamense]|uniref:GGDEF domain-containing protein n=1 Tax=Vibrio TaxID=662 RepID=UPI000DE804A4|nr:MULTISPECIES: GGDEF domain-containing protein [Vibrio]MDN3696585.1 GGDEF domain-containing protein [Vibrio cortegadensis]NOH84626.1 GGDEF domain-containing protein [Vibrio sp. 03-59-1]RBW66009.1 GGDEF domain-containing protein [Vibrionales bacterium C3R12]
MGILEKDIQTQLHQLKSQLEQVRLTQRDTSFKFKREQKILKRIVTSLSSACVGTNSQLDSNLIALKQELEQQKEISALIPRLAVLERMLKQKTLAMEKQTGHLDEQIKHSGETLQRVTGLPAQLKRDLRNLLSFPATNGNKKVDHAIRLLTIYERAIKIMASNSSHSVGSFDHSPDKELFSCLTDELQHLITELDFDGESGDVLIDIRAKLLIGVSTESLLELTLQILKLVIQGTHLERKTSEQFLEQINSSLASSLKTSSQNSDQSQSYFEHRKGMNDELSSLVKRSQESVQDSSELDELKQTINPLLSQLSSLSERLHHAEQREQALNERMAYGQNQLEALFEVTQDYRRRLDDQAQRMLLDPLTKVYNRTALTDRLELEYRRWIRSQKALKMVLFDIDNFKKINDSFGYTAGDKALKIIARTIAKAASDTDTVARFSGEEFILILPEQTDEYCHELIKGIQQSVSKLPFKFRDQSITITLSASTTSFKDSDTPEIILERLNCSLNEAKNLGTNQVVWK